MANVGAAGVPADGPGRWIRCKRERGRGREDGGEGEREREKGLGGKEDWERLGREGGKNRKDKNEEMTTQDYETWHIQ